MPLQTFAGKFQLEKEENMDAYMTQIGVNAAIRALAHSHKPHMECIVNGDDLELHVHGDKGIMHYEFALKLHLDQEQDVETPDGRKVKTMLHLDGNRLIQKETWQDNSKEAIIVHEIKGDMWISNLSCGGVKAVRQFKRE